MKVFSIIFCFFIFSCSAKEVIETNDLALSAVKKHPEIQKILSNKRFKNSTVKYHQMELGGICGYVGCHWRNLVSVVVTSQSSNSPSETFIVLVEGINPNSGVDPKVTFVELKELTH
jgi:hypothetical protein